MILGYRKKTDEEMIELVNAYIQKYPNASRNQIILHSTGNSSRVRKLEKQGLITLPTPLPSGSKSGWAKHFKYASKNNPKRHEMKYNV
jgi:hypothetical protein